MITTVDELNGRMTEELAGDRVLVFGEGNVGSRLMLVGEAPGKDEELQRRPFVGKAGQNLNNFLETLELRREDIYITNVVKIRPFKISQYGTVSNRPPTPEEVAQFLPYLKEEIAIIRPSVIVTLGNTPLRALLGNAYTVGAMHGKTVKGHFATLFCLYHPASLIYNQSLKATYDEDLQKLKAFLKSQSGEAQRDKSGTASTD